MSHYPPDADEAQHGRFNGGHFTDSYDGLDLPGSYPQQPVVVPPNQPYHPPPGVVAGAPTSPTSPNMLFPTPMVNYRPPSISSGPSSMHDPREEQGHDGDMSSNRSWQSYPRVPGQYIDENGAIYDNRSAGDDGVETSLRYGHVPQRGPRRFQTFKKVGLFHGNFVLDNAVPKKLLEICGNRRTEHEFTHLRYSAATCDPNDFKYHGFTLRQANYNPPRHTELFIVMTMYNEDEGLFTRTMHGIMKNIANLCKRERSRTWGKEGWQKVVVCIVSDGRGQVNPRTLSVIAAMGCYQEGIAKTRIGNKAVTAHIYEYTTQISITPSLKIEGVGKGAVPIQIIFCLKERNQKKINSHRWFFNAFGPILQPNVCVLLDVGTMPGPLSIYHLWKAFDNNPKLGGACGEIVALKGKFGSSMFNPLVAAQNFEYKMSNILDKSLESVFGYITVLPGAFSAYRYKAVQNDQSGEAGPLHKYFLGEKMQGASGIFTSNMYLAEDRILCWELVSKRGCAWTLHYVKSAYAVTDVPDQVPEWISQRRRWLNGSFFAAVHSTFHFYYIYRSSHSFLRKFWIHIEMFYQLLNLIFSWFALANYYIAFSILSTAIEDKTFGFHGIHIINLILNYFYLGLVVTCFILALGNRPQGSKLGYTLAIIGFALITIYMTLAATLLAYKGMEQFVEKHEGAWRVTDFLNNVIFRNVVLSITATLGLYIYASVLFFEPWHMITSFMQYYLLAPSYINVLNVYAFANVHDVSWGTKGDNTTSLGTVSTGRSGEVVAAVPDEKDLNALYEDALHVLQKKKPKEAKKVDKSQRREDYYRNFRTNVLLTWVLTNSLLATLITGTNASAATRGANASVAGYMTFLLYSVAVFAFVKACGSTIYMIFWLIFE